MSVVYDKNYFLSRIYQKLAIEPNTSANSATEGEIYLAAAEVVREIMADKRKHFLARINAAGQKQVYYLSMEFLMGRSLRNSLFNLPGGTHGGGRGGPGGQAGEPVQL